MAEAAAPRRTRAIKKIGLFIAHCKMKSPPGVNRRARNPLADPVTLSKVLERPQSPAVPQRQFPLWEGCRRSRFITRKVLYLRSGRGKIPRPECTLKTGRKYALFITYASYSHSGVKGLVNKPSDRSAAVKALIEKSRR